EAHPLDTVRAGLKAADMNAELWEVSFPGAARAVRNAKVVESPPESRDGRWILVGAPGLTHETAFYRFLTLSAWVGSRATSLGYSERRRDTFSGCNQDPPAAAN